MIPLIKSRSLLDFDQVPVTYREVGIETGYRKPSGSLTDCILSAFFPSNETLNFWTHFLPFWYFVYILEALISDDQFASDRYHWPFIAFMFTVCTWPALSCLAHLFSTMSETCRHICFFIDYVGLSWYSFGAGTVYHAYCFPSVILSGWFSSWFVRVSAISSILCTILACFSRFIVSVKLRKAARIAAFGIPYNIVNGPLFYRMFHCTFWGCEDSLAIPGHFLQFFWAQLGMVLYWLHFPERWAPRRFDFIGHSHQLFHICGILATYFQVHAVLTDVNFRRNHVELNGHAYRAANDVSWTLFVLGVDCLVLAVFSAIVLWKDGPKPYSSCEALETLEQEDEEHED